jgi:hypothetical protein
MAEQVTWTKYAERAPEKAGPYLWRVPSKCVKGLVVQFVGHMRERGAGYQQVLSPIFDHWDGYSLHVPAGTEWTETDAKCQWHQTTALALPGIELLPCPFCRRVPKWSGVERSSFGGTFIGSEPNTFNSFWLECCQWARTPHRNDPHELAKEWNALIRGDARQ